MWKRAALTSMGLFYVAYFSYWTVHTFFIVPRMDDPVYYVLCIATWVGLIFMPASILSSRNDRTPQKRMPKDPVAARRSALKRQNGGSHTDAEWFALCQASRNRCVACKQKKPLTRDHIVPIFHGGTDNIDNIQPLCQSCNSSKGARTIDYRKR